MVSEYLGPQPFTYICLRFIRHHPFISHPFQFLSPFPSPWTNHSTTDACSTHRARQIFYASLLVTAVKLLLHQVRPIRGGTMAYRSIRGGRSSPDAPLPRLVGGRGGTWLLERQCRHRQPPLRPSQAYSISETMISQVLLAFASMDFYRDS